MEVVEVVCVCVCVCVCVVSVCVCGTFLEMLSLLFFFHRISVDVNEQCINYLKV